jgi:hypothetical protein
MEDQFLQLDGQSLNVSWIVRRLDSAQEIPDYLIGGAHGSRIPGAVTGSADELVAGGFLGFRPSGPYGVPGAFAALFRGEFRGSGGAAFLAALASQSNGGWILLPGCHIQIIRDRSRIRKYVSGCVVSVQRLVCTGQKLHREWTSRLACTRRSLMLPVTADRGWSLGLWRFRRRAWRFRRGSLAGCGGPPARRHSGS